MDSNYEYYKWLDAQEVRPRNPNGQNEKMSRKIDTASKHLIHKQLDLAGFVDKSMYEL